VYFVEICTVDVKSIVINQVETINFGVTAIVTQCIFLLFSVTGLQTNTSNLIIDATRKVGLCVKPWGVRPSVCLSVCPVY